MNFWKKVTKVIFAEIDIDEKAIKSLDVVMDFDFETGEIGEIKNIKYEDIIGE